MNRSLVPRRSAAAVTAAAALGASATSLAQLRAELRDAPPAGR